jgi:GTPase SAR1 family protein
MYSVTSRETFQQVAKLQNEILDVLADASNKDGGSKDASITSHRPRGLPIPICIVGNKIDLHAARKVSYAEGAQLAKSLDCSFLESSAKWAHTVSKTFDSLVRAIRLEAGDGQERVRNKAGLHEAREDSPATGTGIFSRFVQLFSFKKRALRQI